MKTVYIPGANPSAKSAKFCTIRKLPTICSENKNREVAISMNGRWDHVDVGVVSARLIMYKRVAQIIFIVSLIHSQLFYRVVSDVCVHTQKL